jgi:hypothetical protein
VPLSIGQLCTVVYGDGGFRVALPVELAAPGQSAYLCDFSGGGVGVPVRLRSIDEVAATVPEDPTSPRLTRVVGTLVYDARYVPAFVPLAVKPVLTFAGVGSRTVFVVFADTSPVVRPGFGIKGFYERTPGEFDIYIRRGVDVSSGDFQTSYENIYYVNNVVQIANAGYTRFISTIAATPVTTRTDELGQTRYGVPLGNVATQYSTAHASLGAATQFNMGVGELMTPTTRYFLGRLGNFSVSPTEELRYTSGRSFRVNYEYFPIAMQNARDSFNQWDELPPAFVYQLPLASDALEGTINDILPTGVDDTDPLVILRDGVPTPGAVVSRINAAVGADGVREVRFITALASVGATDRVQTLIGEIAGSLRGVASGIGISTTPATNNDWLGALATSAAQLPDA